jgi:hypothetical protein
MSLVLTPQLAAEIWQEAHFCYPPVTSIDRLETIYTSPAALGKGYHREMELIPGLELCIINHHYKEDITFHGDEADHLVQFKLLVSGVEDTQMNNKADVLINRGQSYIGGSGIQPRLTCRIPQAQPQIGVDIHLQPELVRQLFATTTEELPPEWRSLVRHNEWQQRLISKTTREMRSVVQQIMHCPLTGSLKQLYLQGKVFELIALQLSGVKSDVMTPDPCLKPSTIAQLHHAAEILRSQVDQPPTQTELAKLVGVSDRTLRRGFRTLFNTTVSGYLMELRLQQAEQLLRHSSLTVAEVAQRRATATRATSRLPSNANLA